MTPIDPHDSFGEQLRDALEKMDEDVGVSHLLASCRLLISFIFPLLKNA